MTQLELLCLEDPPQLTTASRITRKKSVSFEFTTFQQNGQDLIFLGDAHAAQGTLQLSSESGSAIYADPVPLWDPNTKGPYRNTWDPNSLHLGIDVDSVVSVANTTLQGIPFTGLTGECTIRYNSNTKELSVSISYIDGEDHSGTTELSYPIYLNNVLPENIQVGLSAGTGQYYELHQVLSRSFSSTLHLVEISGPTPAPESGAYEPYPMITVSEMPKLIIAMIVGAATATVVGAIAYYWFIHRRKRLATTYSDSDADEDYERGTGPKKFRYEELKHATNNFAEERKLGEGGFGSVYRGFLKNPDIEIAVKRVS
ncbi:hypothetical protein Droror1_Dr00001430 [Drosera rotundifolia]